MTHIKDLIPDPKNRRAHNPRNIGMLVDALHNVGASRSIVVDENDVILAGNGVVEAASEAGLTKVQIVEADGDTIIAVKRRGLTDAQKRDLAIYDNRTAELATWNAEQLQADAREGLSLAPFFFDEELQELFEDRSMRPGRTDPDEVPVQRSTDIDRGDLFECGSHLVLCGDATDVYDIDRLMNGAAADFVLIDPPYGMGLNPDWTGAIGAIGYGTRGNKYHPVIGDDAPFDPTSIFMAFPCREIFLFGADYYAERIPARGDGSWLVWDKRKPSQAEAIGAEFELIWSKSKHKRRILRHDWFGFLSSANTSDAQHRVHPTQKPVSLLADILTQWGSVGDCVADTYIGAGSTLIACEQTGRACRAMELSPPYCQTTIDRWEAFTGLKAVKVGEAVRA